METTENLLKRHSDFEAKLAAQEDRLKAFSKNADMLIRRGHSESAFIEQVSFFFLILHMSFKFFIFEVPIKHKFCDLAT